jgi:TonB family protein
MMIVTAWLVHCVIVSAVLGAGALAWELAARWSGRPARWAWLGALSGSVTLPWLLRLVPEQALPEVVPTVVASAMSPVLLMTIAEPPSPIVATLVPAWSPVDYAFAGWLVLSLLVAAYVARMVWSVARARGRWRPVELDGGRIYLTRNVGPAALGLREGMIVLPEWALQLEANIRSLLLLHEREHVRAGDPRLVFSGLLLVAAMPWNPVLWLLLLRLRNAIELDCDARVLASGASPRLYGALLLEVGSRRGGSPLVMATFAEPRVFLEERIRRIARWPLRRHRGRAAGFALVALALFTTALSARDPLRTTTLLGASDSALDAEAALPTVAGSELPASRGVEIPPTPAELLASALLRRPELQNPATVKQALLDHYPAELSAAGLGGTATVRLHITRDGAVDGLRLAAGSGYAALDEAALRVAAAMQFFPARDENGRVAVWIEVPIVFNPAEPGDRSRRRPHAADGPAFVITGATASPRQRQQPQPVLPELINAAEVHQALLEAYPPLLRDAGVGGVAVIWLFIDTDGRVLRTQIASSSEQRALDEAALSAVPLMRFRPYVSDVTTGQVAQTWVELPIVFGAGQRLPAHEPRESLIRLSAFVVAPPRVPDAATRIPPVPERQVDISKEPTFTPMTVRPELQNAREIQRELVRHYPPVLRDAGIGGTPVLWFFIDEGGNVVRTQISRSSGYPALDEAALRVAAAMRFKPAKNRDRDVSVWVEIPMVFTAR